MPSPLMNEVRLLVVPRATDATAVSYTHLDVYKRQPFDNPLGLSTGAATIFGRTGGVMEAALRSAAFLITGENPDFSACDTTAATPETPWMSRELAIGDATVRIAVASGLENTSKLLDALESGEVVFDFVEIMACPGGCVGGGGQPIRDRKSTRLNSSHRL